MSSSTTPTTGKIGGLAKVDLDGNDNNEVPSRIFSPVPFQSKLEVVEQSKTPHGSLRGRAVVSTSKYPTGRLSLQDGTTITGFSFGAETSVDGEVVFNTGMVGYPEALTDPSYRGQILVLTFPLVGNYGVPGWEKDDLLGLPKHFESDKIHIRAMIVSGYTEEFSHWNAKMSLGAWLKENNIPGLFGVDTRYLTKKLREEGTILGRLDFSPASPGIPLKFTDPSSANLVAEVSTKEPRVFNEKGFPHIVAYDCGMKYNIIRTLVQHGVKLTVVPYDFEMTKERYAEFDGIFVSNGPGNPEMARATIEQVKLAMEFGRERRKLREEGMEGPAVRTKPIFGICLGNQSKSL
jgi:carbamoyl-phosphate synthase small subunit